MFDCFQLFSLMLPESKKEQLYNLCAKVETEETQFQVIDFVACAHRIEFGNMQVAVGVKKAFRKVFLQIAGEDSVIGVFYRSFYWGDEVSLLKISDQWFVFYRDDRRVWIVKNIDGEIGRIRGSFRRPKGILGSEEFFKLKFAFFAGLFENAHVVLTNRRTSIKYRKSAAAGGLFEDANWARNLKFEEARLIVLCLIWRETYYLSTNW